MRLLDDIRRSQSAFNSVVSYGGDAVKWDGDKGKFKRCPTRSCKGGSLTIGLKRNGYVFYCHRCRCTGDAIGLLSGYQRGRVDTTDLAGDKHGFMRLMSFFNNMLVIKPAESPRQTIKRRRHWACRVLGKSELLSTEQVLILAYASPSYCRGSVRGVVDYAIASAPNHPANSLRRRGSRWHPIWELLDQQSDDPERWTMLLRAASRRDDNGKYIMSAGARFMVVVGYYSVASHSPALRAMATQARVSLATARRWWNYWVACGIFTGRIFMRRKATPIGEQLKLGLVKEVSDTIKYRKRVRKSRAFNRDFNYMVYVIPLVVSGSHGFTRNRAFNPPRE